MGGTMLEIVIQTSQSQHKQFFSLALKQTIISLVEVSCKSWLLFEDWIDENYVFVNTRINWTLQYLHYEETQGNGNQVNEQPVQVSHLWFPPECILNRWNNCKAQTIHIILCVCCCFASHIKLICLCYLFRVQKYFMAKEILGSTFSL